ncbi:MAG: hypothetical protein HY841_14810 [Bacteroidetes bacterium]|nr:hypothetical protein [Bacteroidota bacterium]
MDNIGQHFDRQIFYLNPRQAKNWADSLPTDNWAVLLIADNLDSDLINKIANQCLDKNVRYVCATGQQSKAIEETFDQFIVQRKIDSGESADSPDNFEDSPLTVSDDSLEEEFWFSLTTAFHPNFDITKVICLDLTDSGQKEKLTDLVTKINSGWLPSDNESLA